mgnify:FL=1
MSIYRIFPEKDTFIDSKTSIGGTYGNAGLDEIIEVGGYFDADLVGQAKRTLIQFNTGQIKNTVDNKTLTISASLNLRLAAATELPSSYTLYGYPISQSWVNGIGKGDDQPKNTSGVSWKYKDAGSTEWTALGSDFITNDVSGSTTHGLYDTHDVKMDVTSIVEKHYSGSLPNNGIIVKADANVEFNTTSSIKLNYFSKDTNTVYKPFLEFLWDDSSYVSSLATLSTDIATITLKNAKENYAHSDEVRIRLSARPKYPTRTFTTSSIYLTEYKLPQNTYWGIKDETTGEMVVDFNTSFTKVSADNISSYFDVHMTSLEPERHYRVLVKTTLNNSTIVVDNKNIFKVTKHG